jgi:hypothetical protein
MVSGWGMRCGGRVSAVIQRGKLEHCKLCSLLVFFQPRRPLVSGRQLENLVLERDHLLDRLLQVSGALGNGLAADIDALADADQIE